MNILDKLLQIKDNESKIYQAGYDKGLTEGGIESEVISTKLDAIIELQEYYMPNTFVFEDSNGVTYSLEFKEGMTWGEWCNSSYNTVGMYINTDNGGEVIYWGVSPIYVLIDPTREIIASDLIDSSRTYKA